MENSSPPRRRERVEYNAEKTLRRRCTHRNRWPPGRSCVSVCLAQAAANRFCAICRLSHALVWEYNIPQWRFAEYVAVPAIKASTPARPEAT